MAPTFPRVVSTSDQAWKLMEKDFTLRHSLVANRWAGEHLKATNRLFAEALRRGNSAYLGPAWVDMEIEDMNRRAEWIYQTCCEIWEVQGRQKCRPFFRAIFEAFINPILSVRVGCFEHAVKLHETRTRRTLPQGQMIFRHIGQQMGHLRAEWNTKLEIATRDNEYQLQLARERDTQHKTAIAVPTPPVTSYVRPKTNPRPKVLTSAERQRIHVIFGAIQAELKGQKYCAGLDARRLPVPVAWKEQGCPATYSHAYMDDRWRQKVQDEKSRYREKFDVTPASERKRIIDGVESPRRTRQ
jgi:hypothetical protein